MKELDIELICAHSPQAKGRVERANQTLQDRLTKELRLRRISSPEKANSFLPEFIRDYNVRFAVARRSTESAHRLLHKGEDLDRFLTLCERRTLSKNLTLSYNNVIYQIKTKRAAYTMRSAHVEVREMSTGEITLEYKGRLLEHTVYREQEQHQAQVVPSKLLQPPAARVAAQPKQKRGPVPMSHPWRLFDYSEKSYASQRAGASFVSCASKVTSLLCAFLGFIGCQKIVDHSQAMRYFRTALKGFSFGFRIAVSSGDCLRSSAGFRALLLSSLIPNEVLRSRHSHQQ